MTEKLYTPTEVLPISGDIILLDAINGWGEDWLEARVEHHQGSLFSDRHGNVPNWVGLEYMAQAVGALAGIRNLQSGKGKRIGFLLGTHKYHSYHHQFEAGVAVTVRVDELLCDDDTFGVCNCTIKTADTLLAQASIKMVQPDDIDTHLKGIQMEGTQIS